ncbi:type VI secretion system accessory protein TagJ [Bordetella bronchialis]|uniref:ImpE family protein n=1 Tax=Bordetella bronchialis TaxID=463025 RepID=A0ABN4R5V4_9BORD|nr:type VI secretion system accessory protein TagJ [Bordetella bronchialis]ANN68567.1 ImpE family protein [Bordetella bronchialis]
MTLTAAPLHAGSLAARIESVVAGVRRQPGDADLRAQLFQLLAVQGEWERAAEQIKLCAELNPQAAPMALMYDRAIAAERRREAVLAGQAEPALPGPRPDWLDALLQALRHDPADGARAAALRARALEDADTQAGTLELAGEGAPRPFDWICDGDSRLGPVFEFIHGEHYAWLPFPYVRGIRLLPPEGLSDVLWARAEIALADGRVLHALVPARYPAPAGRRMGDQDERLRLGRLTQWEPLHAGQGAYPAYTGAGQKMWLTDRGEYALLDIRGLERA